VAKPVYYICSRSKVIGQGHGVSSRSRHNVTYQQEERSKTATDRLSDFKLGTDDELQLPRVAMHSQLPRFLVNKVLHKFSKEIRNYFRTFRVFQHLIPISYSKILYCPINRVGPMVVCGAHIVGDISADNY